MGGLGRSKRCPLEQAQTDIDGAGVQCIDRVVQIDAKSISRVELASTTDKNRREVRPDHPIARLVGVGQRRAFDRRTKSHRIQLAGIGRQADLDIAQALAPSELRKGHCAELLGTGQHAHTSIAAMTLHDPRKARPRHELHDLSKQGFADVHAHSPRLSSRGKYAILGEQSSNRHQTNSAYNPRQCLISGLARVI